MKMTKENNTHSILIRNINWVSHQQNQVTNGYVIIENGTFSKLGEGEPTPQELDRVKQVKWGKGKWLIPGFVNTHTHTGMNLQRGYSDQLPLQQWLQQKMWPFEANLDREAVAAARGLAMVEMIESGTTTFLEMYHLFMDDFAEDIINSGMRASLMRSMIGLCSREEQDAKLKEATNFAKTWHKEANGRIHAMMAPHAPYTCPPDFIERIVEVANDLSIPVHMHLAETVKETEDHIHTYGLHPIQHLEKLQLLNEVDWLFAHAVHLKEKHIEIIQNAKSNISISHNPISNLKLGSGIAPIKMMLDKGIPITLGTDSVASNNTLDMVEEMRVAALIHKGINQNPMLMDEITTFNMATINGYRALQFEQVKGIVEGSEADFLLINQKEAHLQPSIQIFSHLVFALNSHDITDVYVQGKALMENRELLTLDKEKIIEEANAHFHRLEGLLK
ncbi:putative hydrolase [Bacillus sp. TS-2]|nr:putative hydrolase [Bacillus sp. TS-2]